jgi:MFS family permease
VAVLAGQAMASLDTSIVNVGAPAIERGLHLSAGALQLAIYAYLLTYASGLIIAARVGARRGFGTVFTAGVAVFTLSSLACGLAADPAMLVGARAVQGIGAAMLVAQVLSLLQAALSGERRRRALSLYGMVLAGGVAAGQVVGGVLITANVLGYGWRPIFLVNVPVGLLLLLFAGGRLPAGPGTAEQRLDVVGAFGLVAAMFAVLIPLSFGADAGWPMWSWPTLAVGAGLIFWFVAHEARTARRGRAPLIDPSMLRRAGVRIPLGGVFAQMACYGALLFTIALFLQGKLHETPLHSGLTFAAYAAGFATASLTWTRLPDSLQDRVPLAGFAVLSGVMAALAFVTRDGWPWYATALLFPAGAGHGAGFGSLVRRATAALGEEHASSFSGVLATVNQLAVAGGIAVGGTLYAASRGVPGSLGRIGVVLVVLAGLQALVGAFIEATYPRTSVAGSVYASPSADSISDM